MVSILTGVPGSGKTFKAVNDILSQFNRKNSDFTTLYTNIAGFDFDLMKSKLKKNKQNQDCYEFKESLFTKHINSLYDIYKNEEKTEEDLVAYAQKIKLYKSYIVIDEAHNFLSFADSKKIWFLTYHRHMFIELVLITQNIALIHRLYLKVIEVYFDAHRRSNALTNAFKYSFYTSDFFIKENRIEIQKISPDKKVFELYQSGDSVKGKKVVKKFIYLSILAIIGVIFFSYISYKNTVLDVIEVNKKISTSNKQSASKSSIAALSTIVSDDYHLYFTCLNAGPGDNSYCLLDNSKIMYQYDYVFSSLSSSGYDKTYSRLHHKHLDTYGVVIYEYNVPLSIIESNFPRWYDFIQKTLEPSSIEDSIVPSSEKIAKLFTGS